VTRDVAASIRQRLLNEAKRQDRPFQELLQYFAVERFLYRLSLHPLADRFVLKGALLLTAWQAAQSRPTVDIDLSARSSNDHEHTRRWIEEKGLAQTETIRRSVRPLENSSPCSRLQQDPLGESD
jgi:hypothetical protein